MTDINISEEAVERLAQNLEHRKAHVHYSHDAELLQQDADRVRALRSALSEAERGLRSSKRELRAENWERVDAQSRATKAERRAETAEAEAAKWKKLAGELAGAAAYADEISLAIDVSCMPPGYGLERQKVRDIHHALSPALAAYEAQVNKGKETK